MNSFDETFFKKYIPEGQKIIDVFHRHWIKVIDDIILWVWLWVLIPVFLYYNSLLLQETIEFIYLEIYLLFMYIVIIYKIFDWYNDVLIMTDNWIIKLNWSLLKTNTKSVEYEHIEWVEVDKNWVLDKIMQKWDLIIHLFWEDEMIFDEAIKPYKIVNSIEAITSQIDHTTEDDKFDLMMDALGWIVQNFLDTNNKNKEDIFNKKREDLFEDEIDNYSKQTKNENIKYQKLSKDIQEEFLKKVEKTEWTVDLR